MEPKMRDGGVQQSSRLVGAVVRYCWGVYIWDMRSMCVFGKRPVRKRCIRGVYYCGLCCIELKYCITPFNPQGVCAPACSAVVLYGISLTFVWFSTCIAELIYCPSSSTRITRRAALCSICEIRIALHCRLKFSIHSKRAVPAPVSIYDNLNSAKMDPKTNWAAPLYRTVSIPLHCIPPQTCPTSVVLGTIYHRRRQQILFSSR